MAMTKPSSSQVTYSGTTVNKVLEKSILSYDTYSAASAAAATLPDGQAVNVESTFKTYTVASGLLTGERPTSLVGVGTTVRTQQEKNQESISIKDFGAIGDGVANDGAAEIAAHANAAGGAVLYQHLNNETYEGTENKGNLYGSSIYKKPLGSLLMAGTAGTPTERPEPILWVQKISAANRNTIPKAWDQGAYFGLQKRDGDAYGAAVTGYGHYRGGSGDLVGVHGRVMTQVNDSRAYAGWFYCSVMPDTTPTAAHALELNGSNSGTDLGYGGKTQLVRACMADSTSSANRFSSAFTIGRSTLGGDNGFYTGLAIESNAIIKSIGADNEAIRIDGPTNTTGGSIGGIRLAKGSGADTGLFKYGLSTSEASFSNNNAILLAAAQRIRWGDQSTGVNISAGTTTLAVSNGVINVANPVSNIVLQGAGVNLVGVRKTGWVAPTGAATRTAFETTTVTTAQLAERVKALIDDLTAHGLIGA